jgi:glycosyltransferase involved in cell wall biosynthesis
MDVRKKILFIMPSLTGGGAERVMLTLVKHIDRDRFIPIFVLMKKEGKFLNFIASDIEVIDLDSSSARYAIFKIAKVIKQQRPDIVFSTLGYLNLLIALIRPFYSKKIKFISRESNTVSIENKSEKYPKLFDWLYRHVYNNFDLIITQSNYMRDDLVENFNIDKDKTTVIYNPVDIDEVIKKSQELKNSLYPKNKINLIAVGRLSRQKGFDMLIDAMRYLDDSYHLTILGEGEDERELKSQIETLGLQEMITLKGFMQNPYVYMREADMFILSSRYEGLPNVVLESYAAQTPCIAFDTPGGTAEVIEDKKTGLLVKDIDARSLANAIKKAKDIEFDKDYLRAFCRENFAVQKIVKEYETNFIGISDEF